VKFLTKNKWQVSKIISDTPVDLKNRGEYSTDLTHQVSACSSDDFYTFSTDSLLIVDNNEITCNEPKIFRGGWKHYRDSLEIRFREGVKPIKFKIISISSSEMILKAKMNFTQGGIVTYTFNNIKN
jgi:hypothetical protein